VARAARPDRLALVVDLHRAGRVPGHVGALAGGDQGRDGVEGDDHLLAGLRPGVDRDGQLAVDRLPGQGDGPQAIGGGLARAFLPRAIDGHRRRLAVVIYPVDGLRLPGQGDALAKRDHLGRCPEVDAGLGDGHGDEPLLDLVAGPDDGQAIAGGLGGALPARALAGDRAGLVVDRAVAAHRPAQGGALPRQDGRRVGDEADPALVDRHGGDERRRHPPADHVQVAPAHPAAIGAVLHKHPHPVRRDRARGDRAPGRDVGDDVRLLKRGLRVVLHHFGVGPQVDINQRLGDDIVEIHHRHGGDHRRGDVIAGDGQRRHVAGLQLQVLAGHPPALAVIGHAQPAEVGADSRGGDGRALRGGVIDGGGGARRGAQVQVARRDQHDRLALILGAGRPRAAERQRQPGQQDHQRQAPARPATRPSST